MGIYYCHILPYRRAYNFVICYFGELFCWYHGCFPDDINTTPQYGNSRSWQTTNKWQDIWILLNTWHCFFHLAVVVDNDTSCFFSSLRTIHQLFLKCTYWSGNCLTNIALTFQAMKHTGTVSLAHGLLRNLFLRLSCMRINWTFNRSSTRYHVYLFLSA